MLARKDGLSIRAAAAKANISYATVMRVNRGELSTHEHRKATELFRAMHPKEVVETDQLEGPAERALQDFAYFRLRYFGIYSTPWQIHAAEQIVRFIESPDKEFVVINVPPGAGKALALDTPIPTPNGWSTMKDLQVGDEVFGDDGKPCRVVAKSEVFYGHDCYEVRADDGTSVIADANHLWPVRLGGHGTYGHRLKGAEQKRGPKPRSSDGINNYTTEFLAKPRGKRPQLPVTAPLDLPDADLPIDPYTLGVWLGDGHSAGQRVTCHPDDQPHIRANIEQAGYTTNDCGRMAFSISGAAKWSRDNLVGRLRAASLLGNKHIPEVYFRASAAQRLALLQGLIDTDGYVDPRGNIEFCSTNRRLADGVRQLVHSLGVKASLGMGRATVNGKDCGEKYRVHFFMADAARLPRKAERSRNGKRTPHRYLTVTPVESVPTQCIQVDSPNHRYLAGEGMMVTHNSTLFTFHIVVWLICRNRAIRIMIGSATERTASMYGRRIRTALERTTPMKNDSAKVAAGIMADAEACLVDDYGRFKPTNRNLWRSEEFIVEQAGGEATDEKEATVATYGRDGGFLGGRFDFVIWDDLVTSKVLRTSEARENLIEWWDSEAETRLEPGGCMVLQGQRLHADDLYRYALDKTDADLDLDEDAEEIPDSARLYKHIIYKAHHDEVCKGLHKPSDPPYDPAHPDESGCLLDPRRLSWRELERKRKNNTEKFLVNYQQEDVDPAAVLVDRLWVSGGKDPVTGEEFPGCWDQDRPTGRIPEGLAKPWMLIVGADPSPTKYWSCQMWLMHPATEQRILIDHYRGTLTAPDFLGYDLNSGTFTGLLEGWWQNTKAQGHPFRHVVVEQNAAQRFLLQYDHVKKWMAARGVTIVGHNTYGNKTDDDFGVQMLRDHWKYGRVRLPGNRTDGSRGRSMPLVDEVIRWPESRTEDCVMAQWMTEYVYQRQLKNVLTRPAQPPSRKMPSWLAQRTRKW